MNGKVMATGSKTFSYDTENHLVSMGSTVALVYDGDRNRVAKTVNPVTSKYLVDDLHPTGYPQVIEELVGGAVAGWHIHARCLRISGDGRRPRAPLSCTSFPSSGAQ